MIRATWPNLLASNIVNVQPMTGANSYTQAMWPVSTDPKRLGKLTALTLRFPLFIKEHEAQMSNKKDKISDFDERFLNYYYSLILRNPLKLEEDLDKHYSHYLTAAISFFRELETNGLYDKSPVDILIQLKEMEMYNKGPISSFERGYNVWFVLVELLENQILKN